MKTVSELKVKIFGDGADIAGILELSHLPHIKGFTTNPTLMRKAGVSDYAAFAAEVLEHISDRPVSFEVFADDEETMAAQAKLIATWGTNVFVKIPVTNTQGIPTYNLVRRLSQSGIQINVTALMTLEQVKKVTEALDGGAPSNVSVFAGRIADTGRDPVSMMKEAVNIVSKNPKAELIWASPRELLNLFQADEIGCHIITVTSDILAKLKLVGKDLDEYSLETVKMFHNDAAKAGYCLDILAGA
jgi:transaldolase